MVEGCADLRQRGAIYADILLAIVTVILAIDILGTDFQFVTLPERTDVVCLKGVLREVFTRICQSTCVVERRVLHVCVGVLLFRVLARQGEHIRESEQFVFAPGLMFVV